MISVGKSGSEVALDADVDGDGVLVLEFVGAGSGRAGAVGLRLDAGHAGGARELLVEAEVHDFSRERQVLDRSPAGNRTDLEYVVVRVAGVVCRLARSTACRGARGVDRTVEELRSRVIPHGRGAAEHAGRPVGI